MYINMQGFWLLGGDRHVPECNTQDDVFIVMSDNQSIAASNVC